MLRSIFSSLRMRLLLLVLAVFLPVFALAIYGDYVARDLGINEAKDDAFHLVWLAAADEERLLSSQAQLLSAIARLDAVETHDATACNYLLNDLMPQSDAIGSIAVADLNGAVWCSSLPLQANVNIGDRSYFQRAVATRGLTFSDYQIGRISGVPVIVLSLPVYSQSGQLQGVAAAALNLGWLNRAAGLQLPSQYILSIADRNNILLVRFPDPDTWVGRALPEADLVQAIKAQANGGSIELQAEGEPRLYVFTPLSGEAQEAGFSVSLSIPTAVAYSAVGQTLALNLIGLGVVTVVAMIAAWWVGELIIVRRLRVVTAMTRELAAGNLTARTGQRRGVSELSELTQQFDVMATALQQRDVDLKRQAEELETITRLSREITGVPGLNTTLAAIARLTAEISQSDAVGVLMLNADGKLRIASAFGLSPAIIQTLNVHGIAIGVGVSGRAMLERHPIQIPDVLAEPGFVFHQQVIDAGFRAVLAVPMLRQEQVTGGLALFQHQPRNFSASELSFLQAIAQQCVNAVENARLYEAEREQRELAEALRDMAAALNSTLDFQQILDRILDNVGRVAPYDTADIMLIENEIGRVVRSRGFAERGLESWILTRRFPIREFATLDSMMETPRPILIADTRAFSGWVHFPETEWIRSALRVPIRLKGKMIGILNLDSGTPNFFNAPHAARLEVFADQAAIALENARLLADAGQRADQFAALYETTRDLAGQHDLSTLLDIVVERAMKILKASTGDIYLYDSKQNVLIPIAEKGFENPAGIRLKLGEGVAGRVAQTQQPLIVNDYRHWEYRSPQYESIPFTAVLQVPLIFGGQLIGVLSVTEIAPSTRSFDEADMRLLTLFAGQAASAVHTARLLQATRQRANQLAALYETMRDLAAQSEVSTLLRIIVERAYDLLSPTTVAMLLYDPKTHDLSLAAGQNAPLPIGTRVPLGQGVAGYVAQTREPILVDDYATWEHRLPALKDNPIKSELGVPILYRDELMGVLLLAESSPTRKFDESDQHLLSLFAGQAASAIHNVRLFEETKTRAEQLALLYDAGLALNSVLKPSALLEFLFKIATQALHAERAEFFRLDPERKQVRLELSIGGDKQVQAAAKGLAFPLEEDRGLVPWVCRNRMPLYLPDVCADARWVNIDPDVRSALWVPVEHEDKMLGVFCVFANRVGAFTPQDERLLVLFANQAAVALENARMFAETQQRADRLAILNNIASAVSQTLRLDQLLEIVYQQINGALASDALCIALYDTETNELDFRIRMDEGVRVPPERRPLGTGLRARVITTQKSLLLRDLQTATDLPQLNLWSMKPPRAWLGVPMKLADTVVGILTVESYEPNVYTEEEEQLLVTIADQIVVAIQKARLFEETQRRAERLAVLNNVARAASQTLNLDELLELVYHQIDAALKPEAFCIALYDPVAQELDYRIQIDEGVRSGPERRSTVVGFSSRMMTSHQSLLIRDAFAVEPPPPHSLWGSMKPARSWLGAPMKLGETILGIINVQAYTPDVFDEEDEQLLVTIADQVALAIQKAQLFEETQHRLVELEAVNKISTALRAAENVDEMLPLLLDETLAVMNTPVGALSLYDAGRDELNQVAVRGWFEDTPGRAPARDGIAGKVFHEGKPYVAHMIKSDPVTSDLARSQVPERWGGAFVPIRTTQEIIGVLAVAVELPREIRPNQVRLLTTIAEMAGNAIQRAQLHQQTTERLNRLNALHVVDTAISASLDLRVVLNVLLGQVTSQLGVDAADVLVLNPYDQTLSYSLGRGIPLGLVARTRLRLGEGYPGRAVLERRMLQAADLAEVANDRRIEKLANEGWVSYFAVPLVSKGQVQGVLEIFHRSRLVPDADWLGFLGILAGQAAIAIDSATLFENLQRTNLDLSLAYDATIEGWARSLDRRVEAMEGHSERVIDLTLRLARALGVIDQDLVAIRRGVMLHDIGKMIVPDHILAKPGALTEYEWQVMRKHPQYGYELLAPISYLRSALDIPFCHHEKWDGTGYPRGLQGVEIPLAARLFAMVDVWDALRSARPYRAAWTDEQAREYIQSQAGKHFDPQIVPVFLNILNEA